jgi:hypothetical protein
MRQRRGAAEILIRGTKVRNHDTWRGLYLVGILAAGLLLADALAPLSARGHSILTAGIVFLAATLTFLWTERHADLIERSGIDAQAKDDQLYTAWFVSGSSKFVLPRSGERKALTPGSEHALDKEMWYTKRRTNVKV